VKIYCIAAPFLLALGLSCYALGAAERGGAPAHTAPDAGAPITVEDAVSSALESNAQIHAAVRRLTLAQSRRWTARSLDDPMLMVRDWSTPLSKPWDLNQAQVMVSVQQNLVSRSAISAPQLRATTQRLLRPILNRCVMRLRPRCARHVPTSSAMRKR